MTRREPNKGIYRLAEELANVFPSRKTSAVILGRAGLPSAQIPEGYPDPLSFWTEVLEKAANGALEDGIDPIIREASAQFPGNEVLESCAKNRRALQLAAPRSPISPGGKPALLLLVALSVGSSVGLVVTCPTHEAENKSSTDSWAIEAVFHDAGVGQDQPEPLAPGHQSHTGSTPPLPPDRRCSRTSDCESGWTCVRQRQSSSHRIGSLTKRDDRPMASMLVGRACPDERRRVGTPKTRLHGEGNCTAVWHSQDEQNCEVHVTVEGELFTSPRCDVFATFSFRSKRGRCAPERHESP